MRVYLRIILAAFVTIFLSCTSIPPVEKSRNKSIVVTYIERSEKDSGGVFAEYNFIYDKYFPIRANPSVKYCITKDVEPGKHIIEQVEVLYLRDGKKARSYTNSFNFNTKEGAITILPRKIVLTMIRDNNNLITNQMHRIVPMYERDYNNCIEYLMKEENIKGWEIIRGDKKIE